MTSFVGTGCLGNTSGVSADVCLLCAGVLFDCPETVLTNAFVILIFMCTFGYLSLKIGLKASVASLSLILISSPVSGIEPMLIQLVLLGVIT